MELTLPISVLLPRKTKADVKYPLNLNRYRNTHHMTLNEAKETFHGIVKAKLAGINTSIQLAAPVAVLITIYPAKKCDLANVVAVVEKFFADSIVECQVITDDNCEVITQGGYKFGGYDRANPRAVVRIEEI